MHLQARVLVEGPPDAVPIVAPVVAIHGGVLAPRVRWRRSLVGTPRALARVRYSVRPTRARIPAAVSPEALQGPPGEARCA